MKESDRYKTNQKITKEFSDFLNWYKIKPELQSLDSESIFKQYCEENDCMFHGELRKLLGANTRNATHELLLAFGAVLFAIILMAVV